MPILDQYGQAIDRGVLREPQTARIAHLQQTWLTPMLSGLTPASLAGHLRAADDGDLLSQHRLFADMEDRSAHLQAEMSKRVNAPLTLDWDIAPPRNATAAEKAAAEWVEEILRDAVDPLEDLAVAAMGAVGHGFAPIELEWRQDGAEWLPCWHPRPQEWFQLSQDRRRLTLRDNSADGADPIAFGWVMHCASKPKTGYLARAGLYRVLVWPFLFGAYALGDWAEFVETYGLPFIFGKYHAGATADERASLMRAVSALGHDARAIMPADMAIEIAKVTTGGSAGGSPHEALLSWSEKAISKGILGATLTSGADGAASTNALGKVHNEVREDIRDSDVRQLAATLTRDLIYPLVALNRGGIDGLRRCPRIVFDTGEAEDLALYAESLPKLVSLGMRIPQDYIHDKLRIPEPEGDEAVLTIAAAPAPVGRKSEAPSADSTAPAPPQIAAPATPPGPEDSAAADLADLKAIVALAARRPRDPTPATALGATLAKAADPAVTAWLTQIRDMLDSAASLDEFRTRLDAAFGELDAEALTALLGQGFAIAALAGRDAVKTEVAAT